MFGDEVGGHTSLEESALGQRDQAMDRITKSAVLKSMSSGINTEKQGRKGRTSQTEVSFFCGHTKECLNSDIVKGRLA